MLGLDTETLETIEKTDTNILTPQIREAYEIISNIDPDIIYPSSIEVTPQQIEMFKQKHAEIYQEQAHEMVRDMPQITIIQSGMFGGKTTLAFELEDALKEKHLKVTNAIASVMGESYVTARSYTHGSNRREALRFGGENYLAQIQTLMADDADYIFLDEFSFLIPTNPVIELIQACKLHGKSLLLTGLDTNFLGNPLPAFDPNSSMMRDTHIKKIRCHSFVPGICEDEPIGTHTIRYANIEINGRRRWIYDIGLYPLVVSKELSHIVKYATAVETQTAKKLLENNFHIQNAILYPTEREEISRKILLEKNISINPSIGYNS